MLSLDFPHPFQTYTGVFPKSVQLMIMTKIYCVLETGLNKRVFFITDSIRLVVPKSTFRMKKIFSSSLPISY